VYSLVTRMLLRAPASPAVHGHADPAARRHFNEFAFDELTLARSIGQALEIAECHERGGAHSNSIIRCQEPRDIMAGVKTLQLGGREVRLSDIQNHVYTPASTEGSGSSEFGDGRTGAPAASHANFQLSSGEVIELDGPDADTAHAEFHKALMES
jgi:hypothetical protein